MRVMNSTASKEIIHCGDAADCNVTKNERRLLRHQENKRDPPPGAGDVISGSKHSQFDESLIQTLREKRVLHAMFC